MLGGSGDQDEDGSRKKGEEEEQKEQQKEVDSRFEQRLRGQGIEITIKEETDKKTRTTRLEDWKNGKRSDVGSLRQHEQNGRLAPISRVRRLLLPEPTPVRKELDRGVRHQGGTRSEQANYNQERRDSQEKQGNFGRLWLDWHREQTKKLMWICDEMHVKSVFWVVFPSSWPPCVFCLLQFLSLLIPPPSPDTSSTEALRIPHASKVVVVHQNWLSHSVQDGSEGGLAEP